MLFAQGPPPSSPYFLLFFLFLRDHMPIPLFIRGLACGHMRAQIFFHPSSDFLGYLPEILYPLSRRHLWVLSILPNTSVASFTLSVSWRGLFPSIPSPSPTSPFFHFAPPGAGGRLSIPQPLPIPFPTVFSVKSINIFTSAYTIISLAFSYIV